MYTEAKFINKTDYSFVELLEKYRTYTFIEDGERFDVKIEKPRKLYVSKSGGHRIFSENGISHYIPPKWIHLSWVPEEGEANFSL